MISRKRILVIVECETMETRIAVLENNKLVDLEIEREPRIVDNIYKGVVRGIVPGMDAAFVDIGLERNGFLYVADIVPRGVGVSGDPNRERYRSITEAVREGDTILVQIARNGSPSKGARLTTRIGLRGCYCVLLCQGSNHVGVSVKITDERERERLRRLSERLRPLDCGLILRSHAVRATPEAIAAEVEQLHRRWQKLVKEFKAAPAPSLLFNRPSIFADILWEIAPVDTERIIVDGEVEAEQLRTLAKELRPDLYDRIEAYQGRLSIFEHFNVEPQMRIISERTVPLPSGGYLVVEETEAATFIDVNTGRYLGDRSAAQTILKTNLEAIEEVARQIRLRDLSGIILVDLIDVLRLRDRSRLLSALEQTLRRDRNPVKVVDLTPLGLLEITRQRRGESLWRQMTKPCPHCQGLGRVKTALTLGLELHRRIISFAASLTPREAGDIIVVANPEVASWLVLDADGIEALERKIERKIFVLVNPAYDLDRFVVSLRTGQVKPSLVGAEFLCLSVSLLPPEEPTFAMHENRLVKVSSEQIRETESVRIIADGRWFCEGEVIRTQPAQQQQRWGTR